MKNKKIILIILVAAITVAIGTVAVTAALSSASNDDAVEQVINETKQYEAVPAANYVTADEFDTKLTLKSTTNKLSSSGRETKIYTDGTGNGIEYYFDEDDEFVGIMAPSGASDYKKAILKGEAKKITEDEAKKIAVNTAEALFGKDTVSMFNSIECIESNDSKYSFELTRSYGKDGFIKTRGCNATVMADGSVISCLMRNSTEFPGVDEEVLDSLDFDDLQKYVEDELEGRCPGYTDLEIDSIRLKTVDGKPVVRVRVWLFSDIIPTGDDVKLAALAKENPDDPYAMSLAVNYPLE